MSASTPTLDSLAARGARFSHATTPVPTTLPAVTSLLTGLYPTRHGVRDNGAFRLPEEQLTLAEVLHGQGYETAAFIAAFVLDRQFGLAQGFDQFDDLDAVRAGVHAHATVAPGTEPARFLRPSQADRCRDTREHEEERARREPGAARSHSDRLLQERTSPRRE